MVAFPQHGRCLCGDVEYRLIEDPMTVYLCHCTDCQIQSGASFALSMIVRAEALEIVRGTPREISIELDDGRIKRSQYCGRCSTRISGLSNADGFSVVEPGTLDDTSWFRPVGHIWARSAQPWFPISVDWIVIQKQPQQNEVLDLVRAWKNQQAAT